MPASETCIYCGTRFDPSRGDGDHIIPVQLGEFRNDVRFRRVCPKCNSRIGRSEQQMLRCGVESFLREVVKPNVPPRRRRGRSQAKAAMGAPGPVFTVDIGDHKTAATPSAENPRDLLPFDQIVVHDESGQEHIVRLFPGMRVDQLRRRLGKAGTVRQPKVWLHCDESRWDEYRQLLAAMWPKARMEQTGHTDPGVYPTTGSAKLTVTDHYFRALAKIGFHYYLAHSRRGFRGDEACFASIRDFIVKGGRIDDFFTGPDHQFATPFKQLPSGAALSPARWCHVLAADESANLAIAYVHLFLGPGCVPRSHHIRLARIDGKVLVPSFVWGHVYIYDAPQVSGRYAGSVGDAGVTRLRMN